MEIIDTGVTLNNAPQIKIKLKVTPKFGTQYETDVKLLFPELIQIFILQDR
ncbi:MAG: hypothetical protein Q9M91_01710 [Candidatus Dojkabacteria bacterium]|nr:hypothetical protein [Candidatus Dojkabacteria bacterium]MDQ7020540.1 hypothetical protein [Candidatus Dojkabacteria bacterium]